jgi:hypothetical protein
MIGLVAGLVSGLAIAHLPVAATIWTLTPIVIIRTTLLNSLLGVAFGYLYWRWGLEYAIFSHFFGWASFAWHRWQLRIAVLVFHYSMKLNLYIRDRVLRTVCHNPCRDSVACCGDDHF